MATKAKMISEDGLLQASNVQLLNTVRKYAPNDYQRRIPIATQGNVKQVLESMNQYMPNWDVFWNVFVGRIGRVQINDRMNFTNPLGFLKKPMLRYGMTIQEIQTNLIKARTYDKDDLNVFGREGREPEIYQQFHTQNRMDKYELNIPMEDVLRGSFIEGESIATFYNSLTEVPIASANNDEYLLMRNLLKEYDELSGFYNVQVPAVSRANTREQNDEAGISIIAAMRSLYTKLKYFRPEYTPLGRATGAVTKTNRVIAIIDADTEAILKAGVTAYAFNEDNQNLIADQIVVLDQLPFEGVQAILVDEDWFQVADTLSPMMLQSPLNPSNMSYNYFYHIWQVMSYSNFLNAIMLSTRPDTDLTVAQSTVTGVTLTDADKQTEGSVDLVGTVKLFAAVQGENNPSQAVVYTIKAFDGKGAGRTLPAESYVDSFGVFHAGNARGVDKFVIEATSVQDRSFSATYTVTVSGGNYVTAITAEDVSVAVGKSAHVDVSLTPADATDLRWSAYSADTSVVSVSNVTSSGFDVTSVGKAAATAKVVIVAEGGDPAQANVTKSVTVTVTAPAQS